jgi:hypothetical protein
MPNYDDRQRPKILALDLDGTALYYDGRYDASHFGEAIRGLVEELKPLKEEGWYIVIWTCRVESQEMREHLKAQEIPFDSINDHPWNGPDGPRKIYADVYYDDKALTANGITDGLADRIRSFQPWWKSAEGWL